MKLPKGKLSARGGERERAADAQKLAFQDILSLKSFCEQSIILLLPHTPLQCPHY